MKKEVRRNKATTERQAAPAPSSARRATGTARLRLRPAQLAAEILAQLGNDAVAVIYEERIRALRTRSFALKAENANAAAVEILHTLLGIELKIGRRRLLCPDLATARYLSVFARLGIHEVAVPYDITQISQLADALESSWFRMLALLEHAAQTREPAETRERLRKQTQRLLVKTLQHAIVTAGAGPAVPAFHQNTKQRRPKSATPPYRNET